MRFSANVSILFKGAPFLERFGRAAATGFSAVEFWWPSGEDPGAVERAVEDAELRVALMNFDAGDMAAGDRGLAGDPEREEQFRENVPVALELARSLDCRRMNVLVGHALESMNREEQLELTRRNVGFAAAEAEKVGVEVLDCIAQRDSGHRRRVSVEVGDESALVTLAGLAEPSPNSLLH